MLLRDDRYPIEVPPIREKRHAEIGNWIAVCLDEPDFNARCVQVNVELGPIIAPQPGERSLIDVSDQVDGGLIVCVDDTGECGRCPTTARGTPIW